jgi:hypothetical protein
MTVGADRLKNRCPVPVLRLHSDCETRQAEKGGNAQDNANLHKN